MISSFHLPEQYNTSNSYNSKRKYETSHMHNNEKIVVKRIRTVNSQNPESYNNPINALLTPPQTPANVRTRIQQPNLIISNPVQFEQYSLAHNVQDPAGSTGDQVLRRGRDNKLFRLQEVTLEDNFQTIYEKSVELVKRWKEGGFYMEVFYCSSCQLPFENLDRLKEHIDFMHYNQESTNECMCRGCGEVVLSDTDRDKHELMCALVRPHQCETCSKRFIFEKRLRNHIKICGHSDLPCRVCSRIFKDEYKLKYHMVVHAFV